jgi:hypothetical protein
MTEEEQKTKSHVFTRGLSEQGKNTACMEKRLLEWNRAKILLAWNRAKLPYCLHGTGQNDCLHGTVQKYCLLTGEKIKVKNCNRADWDSIRREITETQWPTHNDETTVDDAWKFFRDRLDVLTAKYVPEKEFREKKSEWMTTELLHLVRKKRRLWKKAKHGQNTEEYDNVAKLVNKRIRAAKRGMEQRLAKEKSGNKKPFFNYVRKKNRCKDTVGPLAGADGQAIKEPAEMAEE